MEVQSPRKQMQSGIMPQDVVCNEERTLIFKITTGFPACVKATSVATFLFRGWGSAFPILLQDADGIKKPRVVITIWGIGGTETNRKSSSQEIKECIADNDVQVTTLIGGGAKDNIIDGIAFCESSKVAESQSIDPGDKGFDNDKGEGKQIEGKIGCDARPTVRAGQSSSSWIVNCLFF